MMKKILCWFIIFAQLLLLPSQSTALTIGEERAIGERLLYSVRGKFPILDAPDIHQYINELGQSVLDQVGPQYFQYHFFVVDSPRFNAFAAPAGLVFFYTGLIETMKNEDELLSVLAHEIGHVVSRHISKRLDKSGKINAASLALGLAGLALGVPALSQGILVGSIAAGQALQLEYSRSDEEQADRLSFDWMQKMSRNPKSMEGMLRTMRRVARYRSGKLPQYLLTHPNPEDRLGYVQSLVDLDPHQSTNFYQQPDNFAFLRFKYRIFQESMDKEQMRINCANIISAGRDKEQVVMAHYGLALLEAEELQFDRAFRYLDKVQQAYPEEYILDIDRATILFKQREYAKAKAILKEINKKNPYDVYGMYQLAKVEYQLGDLAVAEKIFYKVASLLPEYPQLYYELGRLNADMGNDSISRFYLGKSYLYQGRIKTARQYITTAIKDEKIPERYKNEGKGILDKLKELEKKI